MQQSRKAIQSIVGAGRVYLDLAVVQVAYPTAQPEFRGLLFHKPAEANTLNPAQNKKVTDHERPVSQSAWRHASTAL